MGDDWHSLDEHQILVESSQVESQSNCPFPALKIDLSLKVWCLGLFIMLNIIHA